MEGGYFNPGNIIVLGPSGMEKSALAYHFAAAAGPNENAYIESFNGKFRDECLNEHWFISMAHARQIIEAWRIEYNTERTHSSLADLTPEEFAMKLSKQSPATVSLTADSIPVPY